MRTFVFELRARGPKARAKVDKFIDDAFEFYKMKKGEETDKSHVANRTELVYSCLLCLYIMEMCSHSSTKGILYYGDVQGLGFITNRFSPFYGDIMRDVTKVTCWL